ncbi:MAG: tetratricopeptide repeat protein [Phycisphaerales bacterium]|nr:tetratricopeptide repeat protein [Phycisphaerales bacterium]
MTAMTGPGDPIQAAQVHAAAGRPDQARKILESALARAPRDARLHRNLGLILAQLKDTARGVYHTQRAAELEPLNPDNFTALGEALMLAARHADAARACTQAIALDPRRPAAYDGLAQSRLFIDDADGAIAAMAQAVAAIPGEVALWRSYGGLLLRLCRHEEAIAVLRRGISINPARPEIDDQLCHTLNYAPGEGAAEIAAAHRRFGEVVAAHIRESPTAWPDPGGPGRPLRIGYLSPDFRSHSCAHFIEPILRHHDRSRVEPVCYFTGDKTDEVTARLKPLAEWRDVSAVPVRALAETIRRDRIDILFELSGHTAGHSLLGLARRAAPIQATYLGYPNTTGLATIDLRFVDALTDPAPEADALATETLTRLPGCFLCYQPPYPLQGETLPEPARPRTPGAPITFGSFNMVQKLNGPLIDLWSGALDAVPGSRLLLKCDTRLKAVRERVLGWFAARKIEPARIELAPMTKGFADHLALYHDVDVALDTFPYNGTTTTCEALWMGVPVVSLAGNVHASRVGLSLLTAAGLPELSARSPQEFIRTAADLARSTARLDELRTGLRARLLASPLCDGPGFVRGLEAACIAAWRARTARR